MPLKLNVGLSRKVGEAPYGSRGASVNIELEADSALVTDPAKLQERIREIFGLVRSSLAEELNRTNRPAQANEERKLERPHRLPTKDNSPSNGQHGSRAATSSQVKAIYAIARRYQVNVTTLLQERFRVSLPEELSVQEASQVIDELKAAEKTNVNGNA
jgi:hypothetical protein